MSSGTETIFVDRMRTITPPSSSFLDLYPVKSVSCIFIDIPFAPLPLDRAPFYLHSIRLFSGSSSFVFHSEHPLSPSSEGPSLIMLSPPHLILFTFDLISLPDSLCYLSSASSPLEGVNIRVTKGSNSRRKGLGQSFAPSICGNTTIKRPYLSILCFQKPVYLPPFS